MKNKNRILMCCPFHKEITPSFIIDKINNTYYCFGCGKESDVNKVVIDHIEKIYNIKYKDALGKLTIHKRAK